VSKSSFLQILSDLPQLKSRLTSKGLSLPATCRQPLE